MRQLVPAEGLPQESLPLSQRPRGNSPRKFRGDTFYRSKQLCRRTYPHPLKQHESQKHINLRWDCARSSMRPRAKYGSDMVESLWWSILITSPCWTVSWSISMRINWPRGIRCRVCAISSSWRQLSLQTIQDLHGRQALRDAGIRFAALANGREEFPVLELDAVHRYVHLRDIDVVVLAVQQLIVARDVRAVIADVAEKSTERPVIVEGQRQRANGTRGDLQSDAHIHRDAEHGMFGALQGELLRNGLAALVGEQIHGMAGVVPQEVIGPATRLAERIHAGASEEVGLHVHLQNFQLPGDDALVHPLMTGVETARVSRHRDDPGLALHAPQAL